MSLPAGSACSRNSKGLLTFATGQAFPGTGEGTVTSVASGAGLTGGPITTTGTLAIDTTKVPLLNAANSFSELNTFPSVGVGTTSPLANLDVIGGGGLNILLGDPGCGTFAAIGFQNQALSGCANYALLGDASGGTYINASGSSSTIHFRINNIDEAMDILSNGTVYAAGPVGIGTSSPHAVLDVQVPNAQNAGWFENNSDSADTLVAYNDAPSSDDHAYAFLAGSPNIAASYGQCWVSIAGNLECTGSKSAVVPVDGGLREVALYAVEFPENWFEDYGSGQLSNGSARIDLEPIFAQTVNTDLDYHVFHTPNGDCKGLYVSQKSLTSFEVHELGGGASGIAFDYRIIAKRKNYETIRLADYTERMKRLQARLAKVRQNKHTTAPAMSNPASTRGQQPGTNSTTKNQMRPTPSAGLIRGSTN